MPGDDKETLAIAAALYRRASRLQALQALRDAGVSIRSSDPQTWPRHVRPKVDTHVPLQRSSLSKLPRPPPTWGSLQALLGLRCRYSRVRKTDNNAQRAMRHTLFASLKYAFAYAHVPWDACYCRDSGDGALVAVPAQFPTLWLADPLVYNLRAALRRYNKLHRETARIQLRAALHAGQVQSDDNGLSGQSSSIYSVFCNQPPSNMPWPYATPIWP